MKTRLQITPDYGYIPIDEEGIAYTYKKKPGTIVDCEIVEPRNAAFHRKGMALVKVVHEALSDPEPIMHNGEMIQPIRTFDNTRDYLTILAGHYDIIGLPNGKARAEAKSWKFAKMTEEEFGEFYSNLIDASLKALPRTWDEEELQRVAGEIVNFV